MLRLFIGNKNYSSWSLRGWLACKLSGLAFEEVVVPLYDEDWADRKGDRDFQPSAGKVPIIWDEKVPVWDSLAIIEYLNEKTGNTLFWPNDIEARGMARSISAEMHSGFVGLRQAHSMNIRRVYPAAPLGEAVAIDVARINKLWAQARARYGGDGDFLFGAFGAADIMFAPVVTRFVTYSIPVSRFAERYIEAVTAHPFMQDWIAEAQAEDWVIDKFEMSGEANES